MAGRWLFKTEPSDYSFDDLLRDGACVWDGVGNALALINLRRVTRDDEVLVYHTGKERRIVGRARVTRSAYPDPAAGDPRRVVVDLAPVGPLPRAVALDEIRADPRLEGFDLLRLGRLSIVPVSAAHWKILMGMSRAR